MQIHGKQKTKACACACCCSPGGGPVLVRTVLPLVARAEEVLELRDRAANAAVSTDKRLRLPETPRADGAAFLKVMQTALERHDSESDIAATSPGNANDAIQFGPWVDETDWKTALGAACSDACQTA